MSISSNDHQVRRLDGQVAQRRRDRLARRFMKVCGLSTPTSCAPTFPRENTPWYFSTGAAKRCFAAKRSHTTKPALCGVSE
jgi:hypothetical protein